MSNNNDKPSVGKHGGEFIILSIYLFGDVYELWNVNHFLCLFLAVLGTLGIILYDDALNVRQLTILAAILVVIAIAADWLAPPIPPPDPWRGWLQAGNEPTPANACGNTGAEGMTVLIGDNAVAASGDFLSKNGSKFTPLTVCNRPTMSVEKGPLGISVDATIYNLDGTVLGNIRNSGYNIPKIAQLIVEHSPDLTSIVVHNTDGDELVYMRYVNAHTIRIRGKFPCATHPGAIIVTDEAIFPLSGVRHDCMTNARFGLTVN